MMVWFLQLISITSKDEASITDAMTKVVDARIADEKTADPSYKGHFVELMETSHWLFWGLNGILQNNYGSQQSLEFSQKINDIEKEAG